MYKVYEAVGTTITYENTEEILSQLLPVPGLTSPSHDTNLPLTSVSLHPSLGYNPKDLILSLRVKLIFDSQTLSLIKFAFGMMRGLYKEYLRNRTPKRLKIPQSYYRSSCQVNTEISEITGFEEYLKQSTTSLIKLGSESPAESRNSWESSSVKEPHFKQTFRSLFKIFYKFFNKEFGRFKLNTFEKFRKRKMAKGLMKALSGASYRFGLNKIIRFRKRAEEDFCQIRTDSNKEMKNNTVNESNSQPRSPSFGVRDKEIWRKRHPKRFLSPAPKEPRVSNETDTSELTSPKNLALGREEMRSEERRKTLEVFLRFDTFGEPREKQEDSSHKNESNTKGLVKKKVEKLRAEKEKNPGQKTGKNEFDSENRKKIRKMMENLEKNLRFAKRKTFLLLNKADEDCKRLRKQNAARLFADFLNFRVKSAKKRLLKSVFADMELKLNGNKRVSFKKPPKSPLQSKNSPKRPSNGAKNSNKYLSEKLQKFVKCFEWSKSQVLKNKLLTFILITEKSRNCQANNYKKGLRSIFRILESKRFTKICRLFHYIKRPIVQNPQSSNKNYTLFAQQLRKILTYPILAKTQPVFLTIQSQSNFRKAAAKIFLILDNIKKKSQLIIRPQIWYRITSHIKKKQCEFKVRSIKLEYFFRKVYSRKLAFSFVRWENFCQKKRLNLFKLSGSSQGTYGTQTCITTTEKTSTRNSPSISSNSTRVPISKTKTKRILPQPQNIHDYIDDFFEVGRSNTNTIYLPRASSSGRF